MSFDAGYPHSRPGVALLLLVLQIPAVYRNPLGNTPLKVVHIQTVEEGDLDIRKSVDFCGALQFFKIYFTILMYFIFGE